MRRDIKRMKFMLKTLPVLVFGPGAFDGGCAFCFRANKHYPRAAGSRRLCYFYHRYTHRACIKNLRGNIADWRSNRAFKRKTRGSYCLRFWVHNPYVYTKDPGGIV